MRLETNGVVVSSAEGSAVFDFVAIHDDPKLGLWWHLVTPKQTVEIRVTPSGLVRVGQIRSAVAHYKADGTFWTKETK